MRILVVPATSIGYGKRQCISKVFANDGAHKELCIKVNLDDDIDDFLTPIDISIPCNSSTQWIGLFNNFDDLVWTLRS